MIPGTLVIFLAAFMVSGCSGGIYSPLLEGEVNIASPMFGLNAAKPVVSPMPGSSGREPMVKAYGDSWESVEGDYFEYNFNP